MSKDLKRVQGTKKSWAVTGTEIFAFFNLLASSIAICPLVGILILYINESINHYDRVDGFMWSMCLGLNLLGLTTFVFSVLLYLGIYKRRPRWLLSYLIFGVTTDVALVTTVVVTQNVEINGYLRECFREAFGEIYWEVVYTVLGICVVHVLVFYMIYRAWSSVRLTCSANYEKLTNDKVWTTTLSKDVVGTTWINIEDTETKKQSETKSWYLTNTLSDRTWK